MNSTEVQSLLWGLIGGLLSVTGAAVGVVNWLNNRFDVLKTRLHETETRLQIEIEKLKSSTGLESTRELSHFDLLDYKTNANRELIEHRTQRFTTELQTLEKRLASDIEDVKGYLVKTTDFQIKGSRQSDTP